MAPRPTSIAVCLLLTALGAAAAAAPIGNPSADAKASRRKLVELTFDHKVLRTRLGIQDSRFGTFSSTSGPTLRRGAGTSEEVRRRDYTHYQEALSRLTDLDPKHELLSAAEWAQVQHNHQFETVQVRNPSEGIEFGLHDAAFRLKQTRAVVEKVRGKLAALLAAELRGKPPDPETLAKVCEGLSARFPFFANAFHVEYFISDMKGLQPRLGRWDFARGAAVARPLPRKIQHVVRALGTRAFANANVLFADHLYTDAHVMIDAMKAMGLNTDDARFVTTPYPFDAKVIAGVEERGVAVSHSAYDQAATKAQIAKALGELVAKARQNHNPILVIDDGGMAAQVIAEKFPDELFRFRMVEITKAGERIAKRVLPPVLHDKKTLWYGLKTLTHPQLEAVKARYLVAYSSDAATRAVAEQQWKQIMDWVRVPSMTQLPTQLALPEHMFGFAHYTYSDAPFKREVMTPLYTQAVNRATFEALAHEGRTLNNKKVTIISGGAMGLNTGLELRDRGFEVTFVEPDAARRKLVEEEHKFATGELEPSLSGRGLILDLSGQLNLLTAKHVFLIDDHAVVAHGSSKDNPFDMETFKALADEVHPWKPSPTGQASASYVFSAAGRTRTLHFPGNGYTISHRGEEQNVPLEEFLPEVGALLRLSAHALHNDQVVTRYPFFGTPASLMEAGGRHHMVLEPLQSLELPGQPGR